MPRPIRNQNKVCNVIDRSGLKLYSKTLIVSGSIPKLRFQRTKNLMRIHCVLRGVNNKIENSLHQIILNYS